MTERRAVARSWESKPTIEGAGVRLRRALGPTEVPLADPFLLLDDFHSENPEDYIAGFPWHPHRGIETVTYMIDGIVEHGDTIGNKGSIGSGDVQWMTAGSGILHQEMPQPFTGMFRGFQLWVNLPSSSKMMRPRYRDVKRETIPTCSPRKGVEIKVVAGKVGDTVGPVKDLVVEAEYLDVSIAPKAELVHEVGTDHHAFAYVFEGGVSFEKGAKKAFGADTLVLLGAGDVVRARAHAGPARFLLISGKPLNEPVAWRGPIVMNTEAELDLAFREYWSGTFIKGA